MTKPTAHLTGWAKTDPDPAGVEAQLLKRNEDVADLIVALEDIIEIAARRAVIEIARTAIAKARGPQAGSSYLNRPLRSWPLPDSWCRARPAATKLARPA